MNEPITLSAQTLGILLLLATVAGTMGGLFLMSKYVRARGIKTKAQKELTRLARHIKIHRPEVVREAAVVDIAIELISDPQTKEKWRIE
jgi:hypothetical protein